MRTTTKCQHTIANFTHITLHHSHTLFNFFYPTAGQMDTLCSSVSCWSLNPEKIRFPSKKLLKKNINTSNPQSGFDTDLRFWVVDFHKSAVVEIVYNTLLLVCSYNNKQFLVTNKWEVKYKQTWFLLYKEPTNIRVFHKINNKKELTASVEGWCKS